MRLAVAATGRGFDDVIRDLPRASTHQRGERLVEGVFNTRARVDGNAVGYDTIAASGPHACILHWTRNDGPVVPGDVILLDAGVELDSYYTADITCTFRSTAGSARCSAASTTPCSRQRMPLAVASRHRVPRGARRRHGRHRRHTAAWACPVTAEKSSSLRTATTATWCTARATTSASTCTTGPGAARDAWTA
jgi:hypothetical protein